MLRVGRSECSRLIFVKAANQIKSLEGVSRMKSLRKFHIRENQIENLDGFDEDMAKLEYINMR